MYEVIHAIGYTREVELHTLDIHHKYIRNRYECRADNNGSFHSGK